MKHPITQTSNGAEVYVELIHSEASSHIALQPHLLGLVKEALTQLKVRPSATSIELDMGRDIGYDFVIETAEADTVFYAKLIHENVYMRFVKNGETLSTHFLTILLQHDGDNTYELRDAWIGRLRPALPGSENESDASKSYWSNHAYIFNGQSLQARTITKVCPY